MTDMALECQACGKKFRISFAVRPKTTVCPQCKSRVPLTGERTNAAGSILPGGAAAGEGNPVAGNAVAPGASADKPQPPSKPKRLPPVWKSEEVTFKGWTYDHEADRARGGLQKADLMGVLYIAPMFLMLGVILRHQTFAISLGLIVLGVLGLLVAGVMALKLRGRVSGPVCPRCRGPLVSVETVPSTRDCQTRQYTQGASGHAYRLTAGGQKPGVCEIRKRWQVCKPCKRYFLIEKEVSEWIGASRSKMDEREAQYAAATTAASPPAPANGATPTGG